MTSKQVIRRQKAAGSVAAALRRFGKGIVKPLGNELAPTAEPGNGEVPGAAPAAPVATVLESLETLLLRRRDELVAADEAHLRRHAAALAQRRARDRQARDLRRQILTTRNLLEGAHGDGASQRIGGITGRTARQPILVARQARRLARNLARLEPPRPADGGNDVHLDLAPLADALDRGARDLERALDRVSLDRRELEETLQAKTRARESFDTTYFAVVDVLEAFCRLAGEPELARRVRVRLRRRVLQAVDEEGTGSAEDPAVEGDVPASTSGRSGEAPRLHAV